MARSHTIQAEVARDAGMFELADANMATTVGYATAASGVLLSAAIGGAVAPVPTLGLISLGGGLAAAGQWQELKEYFGGSKDTPVVEASKADA